MDLADRGRRLRQLPAVLFAVVLAVSLAACASSSPTTPSATGTTSAASSVVASSSTAASSSNAGASTSTGASGPTGKTTLTGTVAGGVETGCIVLTDDSGAVLANLMGLDTKAAPVGSKVEVTGEFETDMMTTCQQGKPFTVASVQVQN